jgi:hypothetical protein
MGCLPSKIVESPVTILKCDRADSKQDRVYHYWVIDSPLTEKEGNSAARLIALVDKLRPISDRLIALDPKWIRTIDIVETYRIPGLHEQVPAFDWFRVPATTMKALGEWNVELSYETFWLKQADAEPSTKTWRQWLLGARPV